MEKYKYDAFLSYRHLKEDKQIAISLQHLLETYIPPSGNTYSRTDKIKRIFRDDSELPTSGDLTADIKNALEQSAFLVVVCSEETANSPWCLREIEYFKELHGGRNNRILTLLISGDPHEVFPKPLCIETIEYTTTQGETIKQELEVEPLAANVTAPTLRKSLKLLKTEFLRIAAPILGCSFDDLYQRHQKRVIKKTIVWGTTISALILAIGIYATVNAIIIKKRSDKILEQQLFKTVEYAKTLSEDGNRLLASKILTDTYDKFNKKSENYESFIQAIEPAMTNTIYYSPGTILSASNQSGSITTISCSHDDNLYAISSSDNSTLITDSKSGQIVYTLSYNSPIVTSCFVKDFFIGASEDGHIIVWALSDGTIQSELNFTDLSDTDYIVSKLVYNSEEDCIVGLAKDNDDINKCCFILSYEDTNHINFLKNKNSFYDISNNGKYISDISTNIDIYTVKKNKFKHFKNLLSDIGTIYSTHISNDGYLYFTESDDTLYFLSVMNFLKSDIVGFVGYKSDVDFPDEIVAPDKFNGSCIQYRGSNIGIINFKPEKTLFYEDCSDEIYIEDIFEPISSLSDIHVTEDGKKCFVIVNDNEDRVYMFNILKNVKDEYYFGYPPNGYRFDKTDSLITCSALSHNGEFLITGTESGKSATYATIPRTPENQVFEWDDNIVKGSQVICKTLSDNLKTVLTQEKNAFIYDFASNKTELKLDKSFDYIHYAKFSKNSQQLFTMEYNIKELENFEYEYDYSFTIYNVQTGKKEKILTFLDELYTPPTPYTSYFAVSDNLEYLAIGFGTEINVYDVKKEEKIFTYQNNSDTYNLFISNDGKSIFIGENLSGIITTVDLEQNKITDTSQFKYHGHRCDILAINDKENRVVLDEFSGSDIANNCIVYSQTSKKSLINVSENIDNKGLFWLSSENADTLVSYGENNSYTIWNIPDFDKLFNETKSFSNNRQLTEDEKIKSGFIY